MRRNCNAGLILIFALFILLCGCDRTSSEPGRAAEEGRETGNSETGGNEVGENEAGGTEAGGTEAGGIEDEDTEAGQGVITTFSSEELKHEPYGWDNLYGAKEVPVIWWDRSPRDPNEGDAVEINMAAGEEISGLELWIEWKLNGNRMEPVACKHVSNLKDSGVTKKKYQGKLGPFVQGDTIEYSICAGKDKQAQKTLGTFRFTVYRWEPVREITGYELKDDSVILMSETESLKPQIALSFPREGTIQVRVEPTASALAEGEEKTLPITCKEQAASYLIKNDRLTIEIAKNPFSFKITGGEGNTILTETGGEGNTILTEAGGEGNAILSDTGEGGLEVLTDGKDVKGFRYNLCAPAEDEFYGFGMKYNALNQRNNTVHTYCVNWYKDQNGETYTPVPYYFVPDKYGFYADSTYYSKFEIDTVRENVCSIEINSGENKGLDCYFFFGNNAEIADGYTEVAGKPVLPPVWAFGPWISANEWNRQSEVMEQLEKTVQYKIPTTVIVLEAWSDEETFYTFNDAQYEPQNGDYIPALSDFHFGGRWPDPKEMVDRLHDNAIKVLLWQIPVLKYSGAATPQSLRDQAYAVEQGYVLKKADGSPYRLPEGTWFGNSLLMDFTSRDATDWFLSKRQYLLEEIGIDGFKTDGGEFVWGREVTASDGTKGDELRNAYPDLYAQAYFDYSRSFIEDAVTFSRAGGSSMQRHPVCWVGDQSSTPKAFEEALRAALSASMSGIPFVAWDIAGFSGDVPSSELYQRGVAQAAFSPIMQVHSEASGDPVPSQARTPWNMAERKESGDCLETYRFFANVRMNLLPYIYSEARHSSLTGEPLMRSMAYSFPASADYDQFEYQYMLGGALLVAPVVEVNAKKLEVYLPEGTWYGLFENKKYGSGVHVIECPPGELPVFVREGTVLPMNLDETGLLGGYVGNRTDSYQNLTFCIYPGQGTNRWYDYVNDTVVDITTDGKGSITVQGLKSEVNLEIIGRYKKVSVNGSNTTSRYNPDTDRTYCSLSLHDID
jgi:alpha-glucosidase (family GH31 glycosyl hydrolase)